MKERIDVWTEFALAAMGPAGTKVAVTLADKLMEERDARFPSTPRSRTAPAPNGLLEDPVLSAMVRMLDTAKEDVAAGTVTMDLHKYVALCQAIQDEHHRESALGMEDFAEPEAPSPVPEIKSPTDVDVRNLVGPSGEFSLGVAKLHMPAGIYCKCPKCGAFQRESFVGPPGSYLKNPVANQPFEHLMYCSNEPTPGRPCGAEWVVRLVLTTRLELWK